LIRSCYIFYSNLYRMWKNN